MATAKSLAHAWQEGYDACELDGERKEYGVTSNPYKEENPPLRVAEERTDLPETGIFVRAKSPEGKWVSADISHLDKISLTTWLRSRGGDNAWAENVVLILLGH